jgi:hypothetical protein
MTVVKQIDANTRIVYGFSFGALGKTYRLQRRGRWGWKKTAWTYGTGHFRAPKEIEYFLFWEEAENKKIGLAYIKKVWKDYINS